MNNFKKVISSDFDCEKNLKEIKLKIENKKKNHYVYAICLLVACVILFFYIENRSNSKDIVNNKDYVYVNKIDNIFISDVDFRLEKASLDDIRDIFDVGKINSKNILIYKVFQSSIQESEKYNNFLGYKVMYDNFDLFISNSNKSRPRSVEFTLEKMSKINNVDVEIYSLRDTYIALFMMNNRYYDLEFNGNIDNLIEFIKNM